MKIVTKMLSYKNQKPGYLLGYCLVFCACFLWSFSSVHAQMNLDKAELAIDTNYLRLGQQTVLKFSVTCNKDRKPVIPDWKEVLKDKLDIISLGNADTISTNNSQIKIRQEIIVAKFNEDTTVIDSLMIPLTKKKDTVFIACNQLKVFPLLENVDTSKEFRDIKAPVDVPYSWREILPYMLIISGVVVLIVLLWLVIKLLRKMSKKREVAVVEEAPKIIIPANIIALEKLNKIKAEEKWFTTDSKLYITELTDVLREYIFNRWGFYAQESTTEEILAAAFIITVDHLHLQNLKDILNTADFVKFAKANTGTDENKLMLSKAFMFVESTALPPDNSQAPSNE